MKIRNEKKNRVGSQVPFGRMENQMTSSDSNFLSTSEADYIVAQTYNIDGGQWMS